REIVQDFAIQPHNTYNIDEIGFLVGLGASEKVIEVIRHPRQNGSLIYTNQDGTREFTTVIEGICGDGTPLEAPCIILKAKEFQSEWFKNLHGVPPRTLFGKSPNGWTDEKMGARFLKRNFGPDSESAVKAQEEYRLLIFDGHNSHVNSQFLSYCLDNKVIPLCL
ncbi:CENP-B protein, partial [Choiromyces venosus 120613-1]